MAKANELRFGNWITHEAYFYNGTTGRLNCRVDGISKLRGENKITYRYYSETDNPMYDSREESFFQPISLTPEILSKAGFDQCGAWFTFVGDAVTLHYSIYHKTYTINVTSVEELAFSKELFLHELQNLIFALNGEELNIEL